MRTEEAQAAGSHLRLLRRQSVHNQDADPGSHDLEMRRNHDHGVSHVGDTESVAGPHRDRIRFSSITGAKELMKYVRSKAQLQLDIILCVPRLSCWLPARRLLALKVAVGAHHAECEDSNCSINQPRTLPPTSPVLTHARCGVGAHTFGERRAKGNSGANAPHDAGTSTTTGARTR